MLPANRKRGTAQFTHTPNRTNWKLSLWKVIRHTILHRPQAGLLPWCLRLFSCLCALVTCVLFAGSFLPLSLFLSSLSLWFPLFFLVYFFCIFPLCFVITGLVVITEALPFFFPKAPQRAEAVSVAFSPLTFSKVGWGEAREGYHWQSVHSSSKSCMYNHSPPLQRELTFQTGSHRIPFSMKSISVCIPDNLFMFSIVDMKDFQVDLQLMLGMKASHIVKLQTPFCNAFYFQITRQKDAHM